MSLQGKYVGGGEECWLHFNTTKGQSQFGDYGYQQAYAKTRSEKIEDGEVYIRVKIQTIVWKYDKICFNLVTISNKGDLLYSHQVSDIKRLTVV